jgi:membrane-associated phospholipid phosphatase
MMFASPLLQPLPQESLFQILVIIFIVSFIIPAISIGTLRLSKFISDLNLANTRQRITPFLFVTCFYGITTYMFYTKLNINNMLFLIFATITALLLVLTIITYFWKISVHGAGIGGVLGFIFALRTIYPVPHFDIALAILIVISGLVLYSRLSLNAHTPSQVYAGTILGFISFYFSLFIFF